MWDPLEMVTASRMQNMVQIRKEINLFVISFSLILAFKALGVESPRGRAIGAPFLNMVMQGVG